jgi:TRAP-type mannitol/chloroaromatic compound transport system permease small subunit
LFNRVMQKVDHWIGRVSHLLLLISGILILLMAFAQTYGVVRRYIFHAPESSAYELSQMFLLFCGVLAVAGVEKLGRHVMNDLISSRFPNRMKAIVTSTLFPFVALIFCAVLTWKSLDNALYALKIGQVTQSPWALPLAPIKLVIPLGYTLLCLVLLGEIIHGVALLKGGKNQDRTVPS